VTRVRTGRTGGTGRTVAVGRTVRLSALVAGAALALTGCGMHPGDAAVVGGDTISGAQVDDAAAALCSANITGAKAQGQPAPDLATRGARQAAVQLLIDTDLSQQFGKARGVTPDQAQVSSALAQNRQTLTLLPENRKADFEKILRGYAEGQLILIAIGKQELGDPSASDQKALAAGTQARDKWAKGNVDVEVDPRYGEWSGGSLHTATGSLSVPVSERAVSGANMDPDAGWVAGLPSSQKCS
jgi:hypothetical protein